MSSKLSGGICRILLLAGTVLLAGSSHAAPAAADGSLALHYFYSPGCGACRVLRDEVMLPLLERYEQLEYHEHNLSEPGETERLVEFYLRYGVDERWWGGSSIVFVGDLHYTGSAEIEQKLPLAVEKLLDEGWVVPDDWKVSDSRTRLVEVFDRFGMPAVAAAGLIDGINPCAFAALVFLLAMLSMSGRSSRQILATGLLFAAGVYVAYFGVGFGIFRGLQALTNFDLAAGILYPAAALGTLVLAVLSFRDYRRARDGNPGEMSLRLPKPLLKASHAVTRTFVRSPAFLALAFFAGLVVALVELFCTGQIYLPVLIYLSGTGTRLAEVLPMLAIYVAMFTLPVVALTFAVWAGVSSQTLREWAQNHAATSKLLMTVVFAVLTVALIGVATQTTWSEWVSNCC